MAKKDIIKKKKGEVIYEAKIDGDNLKNKNDMKLILVVILLGIILFMILFL